MKAKGANSIYLERNADIVDFLTEKDLVTRDIIDYQTAMKLTLDQSFMDCSSVVKFRTLEEFGKYAVINIQVTVWIVF